MLRQFLSFTECKCCGYHKIVFLIFIQQEFDASTSPCQGAGDIWGQVFELLKIGLLTFCPPWKKLPSNAPSKCWIYWKELTLPVTHCSRQGSNSSHPQAPITVKCPWVAEGGGRGCWNLKLIGALGLTAHDKSIKDVNFFCNQVYTPNLMETEGRQSM